MRYLRSGYILRINVFSTVSFDGPKLFLLFIIYQSSELNALESSVTDAWNLALPRAANNKLVESIRVKICRVIVWFLLSVVFKFYCGIGRKLCSRVCYRILNKVATTTILTIFIIKPLELCYYGKCIYLEITPLSPNSVVLP